MPRGFQFTAADAKRAAELYERERIDPLNSRNLFKGGLYVILSSTQDYGRHVAMYNEMLEEGFDTPDAITGDRHGMKLIVNDARFPNRKASRIHGFAGWYTTSDLPSAVLKDAKNGMEKEFELRDELAKQAPGIGPKCASMLMRMCGYQNVVTVDIWVLRFLKERGYQVTIPDYKTIGGPRGDEYRRYEQYMVRLAQRDSLTPGFYRDMVWAKFSEGERRRERRRLREAV